MDWGAKDRRQRAIRTKRWGERERDRQRLERMEYEIRRKTNRHKRQPGRDYLIVAVGICFAKLVLCLSPDPDRARVGWPLNRLRNRPIRHRGTRLRSKLDLLLVRPLSAASRETTAITNSGAIFFTTYRSVMLSTSGVFPCRRDVVVYRPYPSREPRYDRAIYGR